MKTILRSYLELCKIPIALLSAFSTAVGFFMAASVFSPVLVMVFSGVFFLICGSSSLNQYQERDIDAVMPRTEGRPLPSGRISPADAFLWSLALLCSGFGMLLLAGALWACALGLFALIWYNGLYTKLKRSTAFAVIPGALIGAIPPAIGWMTGGGDPRDPRLTVLCFFFFIWQVPHSWLLIMHYGREYEKAGIPSLTQIFSPVQMRRIIFSWMCAAAVSGFFLSAMGFIHYLPIHILLLVLSSWFIWSGITHLLSRGAACSSLLVFHKTSYYLAAVLFLLSADKWLLIR